MMMHKKNVNSNDGRTATRDQFYNEHKINKKEIYNQARKQNKRPKSSSNSQGPTKKGANKKPILFSTIDNRSQNALMSQKLSIKDPKVVVQNYVSSNSRSPKKSTKSKPVYEVTNEPSQKHHRNKSYKQVVSIKPNIEQSSKFFKVQSYPYKSDKIDFHNKENTKVHPKTERHKFKLSNDKVIRKEDIIQMVDSNAVSMARDSQINHMSDVYNTSQSKNSMYLQSFNNTKHPPISDLMYMNKDSTNSLKWTFKSKETDKHSAKNKNIEDFEKLFYQSMSNEKGKVVSQRGVDLTHFKTFKQQNSSHYRTISKQKSQKHIKNKKSLRGYETKSKNKSKRASPNCSKHKSRCSSRVNKCKPPTVEDTSR
jgi:hypothetical protein